MNKRSEPSSGNVARQLRQRLEDLRRAGVDRIAITWSPPHPGAQLARRESRDRLTDPSPSADQAGARPPAQPPRPLRESAPDPATERPARPLPRPERPAVGPDLFGSKGFVDPPLSPDEKRAQLQVMAAEVARCTRCAHLVQTRTKTVFGEGDPNARLMFIGEAPGETEDQTGRPFVGRAGLLLTDMITKGMGLRREDVYIANILKCRPPGNRDPLPEETRNCIGYLERQIETIRPQFLCLLGRPAAQAILDTALPMNRLRGKLYRYRDIPTIATWHPAYLLRNPAAKKEAWEDLKLLMQAMGISLPKK